VDRAVSRAVSPFACWHNLTPACCSPQSRCGPRHGSILAFVDDDCTVDPGWLAALAAGAASAPGQLLGGRTVTTCSSPVRRGKSALVTYLYHYYNADPTKRVFSLRTTLAMSAGGFRRVPAVSTLALPVLELRIVTFAPAGWRVGIRCANCRALWYIRPSTHRAHS